MSLVIRYWIGDVQGSQGVSVSEMTDIVSGEVLKSTHSRLVVALVSQVTSANFNEVPKYWATAEFALVFHEFWV